eukprot:TRINITY_DN2346_c0_g1_i1.p1 TRINITY_DN2346_c0_g1~~TRINITY_DN2346_c0_g1_i1.p1  ORF type:complete len:432 (+),score=103.52 TRINITY_DN2346_c0_g1_i1:66-1298(+)
MDDTKPPLSSTPSPSGEVEAASENADPSLSHEKRKLSSANFVIPKPQILSHQDLDAWKKSTTYADLTAFILRLSESIKGLAAPLRKFDQNELEKLSFEYLMEQGADCNSTIVERLEKILLLLQKWASEIPPVENQKSRFGNPAFRTWHEKVSDKTLPLLLSYLQIPEASAEELHPYLRESFGNSTRIDYGTGHEAHFISFLFCLEMVSMVTKEHYPDLVLVVFRRYMSLMRTLQLNYWLEPAGSHGVWGLDDYHFLPFLFGSSQLIDHKYLKPRSILQKDIVENFADQFLYMECIQFINSVKTESLIWHSPMLNDICGVKTWKKVNEGMVKMYQGEVLGKYPIMQHFLFGSLIPFSSLSHGEEEEEGGHHHHSNCSHDAPKGAQKELPTCCISRLPSAVAAKRLHKIPFD